MKKATFAASLLLLCNVLAAQLPEPFQGLNHEALTTGYFLPLSGKLVVPPKGTGESALNAQTAPDVFHALHLAGYSSSSLPSLVNWLSVSKTIKSTQALIPMTLIDLMYDDLHPDAYSEGWVATIDGVVTDVGSSGATPYDQKRAFALLVDWDLYLPGTYSLMLDQAHVYTNVPGGFTSLEIDFDDGLGFRPLQPGIALSVTYTESEVSRLIRLQADKNGESLQAAYFMKGTSCNSNIDLPDLPPWPMGPLAFPWRIGAEFNGEWVQGNAYTLLGADGVFDKPFIFVEGIDFENEVSTYRNGGFGWAQFVCGATENYPFMALMPQLLEPLLEAGYDLVLLDFEDGADHIEKNSELLIHLIDLINTYKTGDEELVIAGASMGGQISRVALRKMELAGTPHCSRLWISMDSPHCGANVPIGLQQTLNFLAAFNGQAEFFVQNFLLRPAARELLLLQLPFAQSLQSSYMAFIDELGYPSETRNIAIANGNMHGISLPFNDGAHMLDFDCSLGSQTLLKLLFTATPGDPFNAYSGPNFNTLTHNVFTQFSSCSGTDCFSTPLLSVTSYTNIGLIPSFAPRLDNAPGGTRASIGQFVHSMNQTLMELSETGGYPPFCQAEILPGDYIESHAFIPTTSALGIHTNQYHLNVAAALASNSSLSPFDRVLGMNGLNSQHSEITPEIIALVLEEVLGSASAARGEIADIEGVPSQFNYGAADTQVIYSTHVSQGGRLYINNMLPLDYGDDPLHLPTPNTFTAVQTSGCGALIELEDDAVMRIGDSGFGLRGRLELRSGAELRLGHDAAIIIDEHSEFVVRSGAHFTIEGGSLDLKNGASLIIEEGAEVYFNGGEPIQLFGQQSVIDLYGAITIAPSTTLEIILAGNEGGKLRFHRATPSFIGSNTSQLVVRGAGMHDAIVEVFPGARFRTNVGFGAVRIRDGRVNLHHDAELMMPSMFIARKIFFSGADDGSNVKTFSTSSFYDCIIEGTSLRSELTHRTLRIEKSQLNKANVYLAGGRLRVNQSEFTMCGVYSSDLTLKSRILNSSFEGPGIDLPAAIEDHSSIELECNEVSITGYSTGIAKQTGRLTLRCSELRNCNRGIFGGPLSLISMSGWYGGGFNSFSGNQTNVRLESALAISLIAGGNDFGNTGQFVISGTLVGMCDDDCSYQINATGNLWPTVNGAPAHDLFDVFVSAPACPSALPNKPSGCVASVIDKLPGGGVCPTRLSTFDPIRHRFMLSGIKVEQMALLRRLADTMNDDQTSIDALGQLLITTAESGQSAGTEITLAALDFMHGRHEDTCSDDDLADCQNVLIETLNAVATGTFEAPEHHARMHLETLKSRLMELTTHSGTAVDLMHEAGECGLEAHAAAHAETMIMGILRRQARATHNAEFAGELPFEFDGSWPAIDPIPEPCVGNFGAWVHQPGEVSFPICLPVQLNSAQEERDGATGSFALSPNPATDYATLTWQGENDAESMLRVHELTGAICQEARLVLHTQQGIVIDTRELAPGMYFVTLTGRRGTETKRLLVK